MSVKLPIARFGKLDGWFIEGDGWTMAPRGNLTISEAKRICVLTAGALRRGAIAEAAGYVRGKTEAGRAGEV